MRTTIAIFIKFIMTLVAAWISFGIIGGNSIIWIFIIAVVGTTINYLLGDLVILPKIGNTLASFGDAIMGDLTAYIFSLLIPSFTTGLINLGVFAALLILAEFFFHVYILSSDKIAP